MSDELVGYPFAVADQPFCCWEYDLRERNLEYLQGVDTQYFSTMARILSEHLDSDRGMPASIAIRALYHQAIEALMSLLGAIAQAPGCVAAWIAKCGTKDLQEVVDRLAHGRSLLTQAGNQRVSLDDLAERTHQHVWPTESGDDPTAARFGQFWRRLSDEFLDEKARAEYNAIKHGHRVRPGGFVMSIGVETEHGAPAPASAMRSMGGSRHGSSFFQVERVGDTAWNIRARRTSINWSVDALVQRLHLISLSITNVVAALQCEDGVNPETVEFQRPQDANAFDEAWAHGIGARYNNMDTIIDIDASDVPTRDQIREHLEQRRQ